MPFSEINNNQNTNEKSLHLDVEQNFLNEEGPLIKKNNVCILSRNNGNIQQPRKTSVFLWLSGISANLITFSSGIAYGWSSPIIPKLSGISDPENNPLSNPLTVLEGSWIASLISLGAIFSPWITVFITDFIGRKNTLLLFAIPMISSHIICMIATEVYQFYIARFLIGMGLGCMFTVIPVYGAEISQTHNRGLIGLLMNLNLALGQMFAVIIGPYFTIKTLSAIFLIPSVLFVIIFGFFVPETPYFFALKNQTENVEKSLRKFRGALYQGSEYSEIMKSAESDHSHTEKGGIRDLLTKKHHLKVLFKVVGLMFFKQMTGLVFIALYTQKIFASASTGLNPEMLVIFVNLVQVLAVIFASTIIERFSRRSLMMSTLGLMGFADLVIGIYFFLQNIEIDTSYISWIPIAAEIFEHKVKSWGMTFSIVANLLTAFVSTAVLPNTAEKFGFHVPFLIFAVTSLVGVAFIWFWVPETRGKTFLEIHNSLRQK